MARRAALGLFAFAFALLGVLACSSDSPFALRVPLTIFVPDSNAVPDFALTDVNPNSATSGRAVSPRDHLGAISGWYFGTAT